MKRSFEKEWRSLESGGLEGRLARAFVSTRMMSIQSDTNFNGLVLGERRQNSLI